MNSEERRRSLKAQRKKKEAKELALIQERLKKEKTQIELLSDNSDNFYFLEGPIHRAKEWYSK